MESVGKELSVKVISLQERQLDVAPQSVDGEPEKISFLVQRALDPVVTLGYGIKRVRSRSAWGKEPISIDSMPPEEPTHDSRR